MPNESVIRVMIVDDHDMVRRGLALSLNTFDDLQLVAEAANGVEAVQACSQSQPDVILMDLFMPEMDGVTATAIIRQYHPKIKIIALTSFKDEVLLEAALQAGVNRCLPKSVSIDKLANTIRTVVQAR